MASSGQDVAREQLREIADASEGTLELVGEELRENGRLQFDITVRFDGLERVKGGLPVRAREAFSVVVPVQFPFVRPRVETPHVRFEGYPHVQWRRHPCLYQSAAEWQPDDGMFGFIERLDSWVRDAARNKLDPDDAPLHPPVAYATIPRIVVPREDTPKFGSSRWFGFAELRTQGWRTEIIGWRDPREGIPEQFAPALLLSEPFPFEYPETVHGLLEQLEQHGVEFADFVLALAMLANLTEAGKPLTVVLGTPMRRVEVDALQHLAVWEISAEDSDRLRKMRIATQGDHAEARNEAIAAVARWSVVAKVGWCIVNEMRPEVTRRRDATSAMSWFEGKRVAIWGCGAIGSHVADSVVRAGAKSVELVDNGAVGPGVLVRQLFDDADIGRMKVNALGGRLKKISPGVQLSISTANLLYLLGEANSAPAVDLVIDCTASDAVRMRLESTLRSAESRPPIAGLAVSHDAKVAMACLSTQEHTGGPLDLFRRLKLEACRRSGLGGLIDEFWNREPRERFQPEPGCSEPTFSGSGADLGAQSARMLNLVAQSLSSPAKGRTGSGWLFGERGPVHHFDWAPDYVVEEKGRGLSVRVSPEAAREMRAWARRSARLAGPRIETGGLAFGELNEAAGVLWITEVEGPPPDSEAAEDHFTCGIAGMKEATEDKGKRFRGSVSFVGSWHTHPTTEAHASRMDVGAAAELLAAPGSGRRTCVLLILSGNPESPTLGAHAFRKVLHRDGVLVLEREAAATTELGPEHHRHRDVGLALSGGGSRAIAFELGCLRALNDLRLLDRLQVVSSVSGGSVLAAMYAYSDDSFQDFDKRVVQLLRRGLTRKILLTTMKPLSIAKAAWSSVKIGAIASLRVTLGRLPAAIVPGVLSPTRPPPIRSYSRSEAFRDVLESEFKGALMRDVCRDGLDTVVNATELRTGSAFRFGSRQSGCWRFGTIDPGDASVADAVAASAAYPALLPALDRTYRFTDGGRSQNVRVVLTDGGVFENLGVSPMEPGRRASISTNVFSPAFVISCDAGAGLMDDDRYPMRWASRMYRSFLSVFRKVQDATRNRLHKFAEAGEISGFVLSYLGQDDDRLPWFPPALPTRSEVYYYPTDFSKMADDDLELLALRGELLTRFLVAYYLHDL